MDHLALRPSSSFHLPISVAARRPHQRVTTISCRASSAGTTKSKPASATDFYGLLSISSPQNVGCDEIKRAYRKMSLMYHPDVCHDPSKKEESTKMFVLLHEAYRTLSDPELRSEYDFELGLTQKIVKKSASGSCDIGPLDRSIWQDQVSGLRMRNRGGTANKEGSWGSRMRAQNRMRKD